MTDHLPAWADAALSDMLEQIAAAGERQDVEFKRVFPDQARDLAKEIAAFATTNAGTIYLGITDEGEIVGVANGDDRAARDELRGRIEGACANGVAPSITPTLRFGVAAGKVVVAIEVPKGTDPVYYGSNIPYLRQLTSARPMKPGEVVDHVLAWHEQRRQISPLHAFIGDLDMYLIETELDVHDYRTREVNPWRAEARHAFPIRAEQARKLAAAAPQDAEPAISLLERLADGLETIGAERPSVNSSRLESLAALDDVETALQTLRSRWIPPQYFGPAFARGQREHVETAARQLTGLAARIKADPKRVSLDTLQHEAKQRGAELLNLAFARAGLGDADSLARLRDLGSRLRLMETRRMPADGGQSFDLLVNDILQADLDLQRWIADLPALTP